MKKILCLIMVCVLIFSLAGCKKDSNVSDTSGNSSVLDNDNLKENQNSSEQENTSSDQAESNDEASSAASSVVSGGSSGGSSGSGSSNSGTSQPSNTTKPLKKVGLDIDTSRAPSTDVATMVEDGYVYYFNPFSSAATPGVYRKKINGGTEEKITDKAAQDVKVLNGKVYYISYTQNLYRCDTDGKNVITLDDSGLVNSFEVAGNWIFVSRALTGGVFANNPYQNKELYVISIDGSKMHEIKPNEPNIRDSSVIIHGFNRGYCYLTIRYNYIPVEAPTYNYWKNYSLRIDYRSKDLTQCELDTSGNYMYDGEIDYYSELSENSLYYDYLCYKAFQKTVAISLVNNTVVKLRDDNQTLYRLRDYCVCVSNSSTTSNFEINFVDFEGNKKVVTLDLSENGAFGTCHPYITQDVHNNRFFVTRLNTRELVDELLMISPEGEVTKISTQRMR